jgi:hypothetical protein
MQKSVLLTMPLIVPVLVGSHDSTRMLIASSSLPQYIDREFLLLRVLLLASGKGRVEAELRRYVRVCFSRS